MFHKPPAGVLCDVITTSTTKGCHLLTFAEGNNDEIKTHCQRVGAFLKSRLVLHGGCSVKFGILCQVINVRKRKYVVDNDNKNNSYSQDLMDNDTSVRMDSLVHFGDEHFPSTFDLTTHKLDSLVTAFIICIAAYKPVEFTSLAEVKMDVVLEGGSYFFLLTCDQFELLWFQQFTRELWIHGPPGAGKTVAAVQFAIEMRRSGCDKDEILYLAENHMLCSYVR